MKCTQLFALAALQLALLVPSVFADADRLPIFEYKGTYKYYNDTLLKTATGKYQAYLILDDDVTYAVWYGTSGTLKWYTISTTTSVDLYQLDDIGNILFLYGNSDLGFGKVTYSRTDGSLVSCSATGTISDFSSIETGTFSLRYNSSLTKKAISQNISALDAVVANLIAKKYVLY